MATEPNIDQKAFDKLITHIELRYGLHPLTRQGVVDALANIVGLNPLIVRNKDTDIILDALAGTMLYFNSTEYQQHQTMMLLHDMIHSHDDDQATIAANLMVMIVNIQKDKEVFKQPMTPFAPYINASAKAIAELDIQTKYPWSYESKELLEKLKEDETVLNYYKALGYTGVATTFVGLIALAKKMIDKGKSPAAVSGVIILSIYITYKNHMLTEAHNSLKKEEARRTPPIRN